MALPTSIDPQSTVLFLGSGFSSGALAIGGKSPPLGRELSNILADDLGLPRERYELQTLADAYSRRHEIGLADKIRALYTIGSISAEQRTILSHRWQRIYTTNYDDLVEFAYHSNGLNVSSYTYDDPKPARIPRGSVIHLHGFVHKVKMKMLSSNWCLVRSLTYGSTLLSRHGTTNSSVT
ncbi:MAG: hypothetical protein E5Y73_08420 [Mesorhizobium sp.]|uniref:SIR2 family protein n=1 Tax=Mesorhizobium sp. TaxID=1871066 RepID=UPI0012252316|nr:MAG: hypothetical protein E5Y73_08420 [Mesorhizobium sp.]